MVILNLIMKTFMLTKKGDYKMKNDENNRAKNEIGLSDKIQFKTGSSTYSFTQQWIENEALKDILVGLIANDYNKQNNDKQ